MQGVFLDSKALDRNDIDLSKLTSTLSHWKVYETTEPSQLFERIRQAHIIVTNKVALQRNALQQAPYLKCICLASTGFDHIDLVAAKEQGVTVCNVAGYSTPSVVQHAIGLMIALASKIVDYDYLVKQGAWIKAKQFCLQNYPTMELADKVLGIIGLGAIGSGVAKIAEGLGMKVLVAQRLGSSDPTRVPLSLLLPQVDVLSLHCPLTKETQGLIGAQEIAKMKRGAILINVARGGLVDEYALVQALRSGHLSGAGVDVLSQEPPPPYAPLAQPLPGLIVTPHIAWSTHASRQRLITEVIRNIQAFLQGKPRNVVKAPSLIKSVAPLLETC